MPRVTIQSAKTETLREIHETEMTHWGTLGPPERLKKFIAEIEQELERRGELLVVRN